jgi:hypothetical protein
VEKAGDSVVNVGDIGGNTSLIAVIIKRREGTGFFSRIMRQKAIPKRMPRTQDDVSNTLATWSSSYSPPSSSPHSSPLSFPQSQPQSQSQDFMVVLPLAEVESTSESELHSESDRVRDIENNSQSKIVKGTLSSSFSEPNEEEKSITKSYPSQSQSSSSSSCSPFSLNFKSNHNQIYTQTRKSSSFLYQTNTSNTITTTTQNNNIPKNNQEHPSTCYNCGNIETNLNKHGSIDWSVNAQGHLFCSACYFYFRRTGKKRPVHAHGDVEGSLMKESGVDGCKKEILSAGSRGDVVLRRENQGKERVLNEKGGSNDRSHCSIHDIIIQDNRLRTRQITQEHHASQDTQPSILQKTHEIMPTVSVQAAKHKIEGQHPLHWISQGDSNNGLAGGNHNLENNGEEGEGGMVLRLRPRKEVGERRQGLRSKLFIDFNSNFINLLDSQYSILDNRY